MKELLMESIPGKSVRGEVLAQFLPKYHRPAEPDVRGLPFRYDSANIFSGHSSILGGDPDAQKYVRGFRECAYLLDRRDVARAGGMEQIDGLSVGVSRELLHSRDEWRDTNACAHPDLALARTFKGEAAVRPFDRDERTRLERSGKRPRVIAQPLDEEKQVTVILPCRGDRERMRPFPILEVHECELPGVMATPAVLEANVDLQDSHIRACRDCIDLTDRAVRMSHPAEQHQDRRHCPRRHQCDDHVRYRVRPVRDLHQDQAVEHEEEKYDRQQAVGLEEVAIRKPAQQRKYHEYDERVEAQLPNGSGWIL